MQDAQKFAEAMMLAITDDFYRLRAAPEAQIAHYLQKHLPHVFPENPLEAPIVLPVFDNPKAWLAEHGVHFAADSTSAIIRRTPFTMEDVVTYADLEEGTTKDVTPEEHVNALRMLCEMIANKKIFLAARSPMDLLDPGCWDVEVYDAFRELAYHKQVIYG